MCHTQILRCFLNPILSYPLSVGFTHTQHQWSMASCLSLKWHILLSLLTSYKTLPSDFTTLQLSLLICKIEKIIIIYPIRLLWALNELIHRKSLKLCFSHSKSSMNISCHYYCCYYYYWGLDEETISYHYKVFQMWDFADYLISWIITLSFYKKEDKLDYLEDPYSSDTMWLPWLPISLYSSPPLFLTSQASEAWLPVSYLNNPSCPQSEMLPCLRRHLHLNDIFRGANNF